MIILCDMDGCVADFVSVVLGRYNWEFEDNLRHEDIKNDDMHRFAKCGKEIYKYFHQKKVFEDCPLIVPAASVIRQFCVDGHDVFFVTKPVDHSLYCMKEKQKWVDTHFPAIGHKRVIFTGHKHMVRGDVLIDDLPRNLERFEGMTFLPDQPWNRSLTTKATRFTDWWDVYEQVTAVCNTRI